MLNTPVSGKAVVKHTSKKEEFYVENHSLYYQEGAVFLVWCFFPCWVFSPPSMLNISLMLFPLIPMETDCRLPPELEELPCFGQDF